MRIKFCAVGYNKSTIGHIGPVVVSLAIQGRIGVFNSILFTICTSNFLWKSIFFWDYMTLRRGEYILRSGDEKSTGISCREQVNFRHRLSFLWKRTYYQIYHNVHKINQIIGGCKIFQSRKYIEEFNDFTAIMKIYIPIFRVSKFHPKLIQIQFSSEIIHQHR